MLNVYLSFAKAAFAAAVASLAAEQFMPAAEHAVAALWESLRALPELTFVGLEAAVDHAVDAAQAR